MAMMLAATVAAGCGDDHEGPNVGPDMTVITDGDPCVTNADCKSNQYVCAYKIGDCAAKGHCAHVAVPTCASVIELCGCDGKPVISGPCNFQSGFASGPTTGTPASMCGSDGGI
jgi:hypothetical protein